MGELGTNSCPLLLKKSIKLLLICFALDIWYFVYSLDNCLLVFLHRLYETTAN